MIRLASGLCLLLSPFALTPAAQVPPRDRPPAYIEAAKLEAELQAQIAAEGLTVQRALQLASLQEKRGLSAEPEATLRGAWQMFPGDRTLVHALSGLFVRQGKPAQAIEVLEEFARMQPGDRTTPYTIATFYEELVRKGTGLSERERRTYIANGIAAADRAIALDPAYFEALTYKNILLRHQSLLEPDPGKRKLLVDEADRLRAYAIELRRTRPSSPAPASDAAGAPPPPPPPPPGIAPPCDRGVSGRTSIASGQAPLRVGGNIKAPTKIRDVRPVYPADALAARVQGVVIIEATIDEEGRVVQACVLRSIPLLDEPALQAVEQWLFTPTLLNGAPVPVVMTVTVNFTLSGVD